jgi:hypothetical protein
MKFGWLAGGKGSSEKIEKFNEAVQFLIEIEQKDANFSSRVFLHQLINQFLDDALLQELTTEINEWVNTYHRN